MSYAKRRFVRLSITFDSNLQYEDNCDYKGFDLLKTLNGTIRHKLLSYPSDGGAESGMSPVK